MVIFPAIFYRVFTPSAACQPVDVNSLPACIFALKSEALDYAIYIGESMGSEPLIDEYQVKSFIDLDILWVIPYRERKRISITQSLTQ